MKRGRVPFRTGCARRCVHVYARAITLSCVCIKRSAEVQNMSGDGESRRRLCVRQAVYDVTQRRGEGAAYAVLRRGHRSVRRELPAADLAAKSLLHEPTALGHTWDTGRRDFW